MNNLLFIALIVVLLWYFYHLAQKTSFRSDLSPPPKPPQTIAFDPGPETLIGPRAKTPPLTSNEDQKELEATLDLLLEEMREFDKELGDFD
ncbi:MAG: hypothetical protein I3274_02780 [Candidatus Moeniiplasma glomeromycotorum]|nr:hypothetical protein [Candidatus Moeniiplasma glomeromycotorum]MCE8167530.1 hypothetical protein [Candidatus Moeniiplasma glomeromycotorum]